MKHSHRRWRRTVALATTAAGLTFLTTGSALAAPTYDRCPTGLPGVIGCLEAQVPDGSITANIHRLPLTGADINIQGGLDSPLCVVQTASGSALTAKPVDVPGGLFGTNLPYNLNSVKATVEQAGPIVYNFLSLDITVPVKIHFTNPLLGPNCYIGSTASPITLTLTPSTTSPPAPNTPITGNYGTFVTVPGTALASEGQVQVDNAFAVPAATGCGAAAQAQVTKAINKNLGLPSAAGHYNNASLSMNQYVKEL